MGQQKYFARLREKTWGFRDSCLQRSGFIFQFQNAGLFSNAEDDSEAHWRKPKNSHKKDKIIAQAPIDKNGEEKRKVLLLPCQVKE